MRAILTKIIPISGGNRSLIRRTSKGSGLQTSPQFSAQTPFLESQFLFNPNRRV